MDSWFHRSMNIVSRQEALSLGLKRYFTGKPCGRGHVAERYVSRPTCLACNLEDARARRVADPERARAASRRWRARNPGIDRRRSRESTCRQRGITIAEYYTQLSLQARGCALCGATEDIGGRMLGIDHCHRNGANRGILCHQCNSRLLPFADNGRAYVVAPFVRYYAKHGCWGVNWPAFEATRPRTAR